MFRIDWFENFERKFKQNDLFNRLNDFLVEKV